MKKIILIISIIISISAITGFIYWKFIAYPAVQYSTKLGVPGDHSPHRRLPELPLDIVLDQDRARIISRQDDGKVISWDLKTGKPQLIARTESLFGYCRANQLLIVRNGEDVILVDLSVGTKRRITSGAYHYVDWNKDCSKFALADKDSETIEIWNADTLIKRATIPTTAPVRNGLAMSNDGQFVAAAEGTYSDTAGHKTKLEVFAISDLADITRTAAIDDPTAIVGMWKMVFAPESRSLVVGSQVDAKSGLRSLAPQDGVRRWGRDGFQSYWVRALAVSPNGELLVSGDEKGLLRAWEVKSGKKRFQGRTGLVIQSLSFSEDGTRLAIALWDSTIGIVDVDTLVD